MSQLLSLHAIEENLLALLDTEDVEGVDREAIEREIIATRLAAIDKRDSVAAFLSHCEAQQDNIGKEIARLCALEKHYANTQARTEQYVIDVIVAAGKDAKGKYRKLEGTTSILSVKTCPAALEVTNEEVVPNAFKTVTVKLPAETWELILDELSFETSCKISEAVKSKETVVDKNAVKSAIKTATGAAQKQIVESGVQHDPVDAQTYIDSAVAALVPGARLADGKLTLVRK